MSIAVEPMSLERRAFLAQKGRILFTKYCGTKGQGICAASFVLYHLDRGEFEVVEDFMEFLDQRIEELEQHDPDNQLSMACALAQRVQNFWERESDL